MTVDDKFGLLLTEQGWEELEIALKPYVQNGPIGRYIYCKELYFEGSFICLLLTSEQVQGRISTDMKIYIPSHYVKYVATNASENAKKIGFI
jgi:hypothetical protein